MNPTQNGKRLAAWMAACLAAAFALVPARGGEHAIWVEGEDADASEVTRHPWWYVQVKTEMLSGGATMAHFDDNRPGTASYRVSIPAEGEYTLWARVNPMAKNSLQVDGKGWTAFPAENRDNTNVAADDQPDLRFLAWVRAADRLWLGEGPHTLEFRFEANGAQHHGYLDCFLLTDGRFTPAGATKPAAVRAAAAAAGAADWVWVEGEDADGRDVDDHDWYGRAFKRNLLSGSALLSHYSQAGRPGTARYRVQVPADGDYTLWARVNPVLSSTSFRLGDGPWTAFPAAYRDQINIADNDQPDHRFLAWVRAEGKVPLRAGPQDISFRLDSADGRGNMRSGYLDCFLLTLGTFSPAGATQPAGAGGAELPADPGCWAFDPGQDHYGDEALFDLRPLLDDVAGSRGWIGSDENGFFVRGDGSPIRFWAVNTGVQSGDVEDLEEHARHLAKRGVNMVRLHNGRLGVTGPNGPLGRPSDGGMDEIQKLVGVMGRQGIYSTISIYWGTHSQAGDAGYRPFGRGSGHLGGLVFWEPELQEAYKNWWRELLTRPNPYHPDRTPMRDDPAFAVLQIQNEDSMLFWTQQDVSAGNQARKAEYDALNALFKEWLRANGLPAGTDLRIDFWQIDQGGDNTQTPAADLQLTMRFMTEKMRAFNDALGRFIHDEVGCPVLINAGNWTTANQVRLLDLERWSYDANDIMGKNHYVDYNTHHNPNGRGGYLVEKGDLYANDSAVRGDGWKGLATNIKQVKGKPTLIPESCWVPPNSYASEGPLLVAAYQGLTGIDAYYWFALGRPGYDPLIGKWQVATPSVMGGWPAAAWMHHMGYVRRGEVAVDEKRGLEGDMWELRVPVIAEASHFDPNRPGTVRAQSNIVGGAPYGAFLVGPVEVEYGPSADGTRLNLEGYATADLERGVIRSNTGELFMNAPAGLFTLDAPCAQGVTGFLAEAGTLSTSALTIDLDNEYATVMAVSLDGQPLERSGKVLLQITTQSRPYGWKEEPAAYEQGGRRIQGFRILDTGSFPWSVKETRGTVAIRNAGLSRATLADANFYAAGEVPVERQGESLLVQLPPNAMYVVLE